MSPRLGARTWRTDVRQMNCRPRFVARYLFVQRYRPADLSGAITRPRRAHQPDRWFGRRARSAASRSARAWICRGTQPVNAGVRRQPRGCLAGLARLIRSCRGAGQTAVERRRATAGTWLPGNRVRADRCPWPGLGPRQGPRCRGRNRDFRLLRNGQRARRILRMCDCRISGYEKHDAGGDQKCRQRSSLDASCAHSTLRSIPYVVYGPRPVRTRQAADP